MLNIRGSEMQEFLRCRKRWDYRWVQGLIPKNQNPKLFFGTLIHRFLEIYYHTGSFEKGLEAMTEMYKETDTSTMDQTELEELWDLVNKVAYNYVQHWNDSEWKVLATELKFSIPLDEHVSFNGTIDLVVKHGDRIIILDHKSTASLDKYEKNSILDRQISRYLWALQQIAKGKGTIFDKNGNEHPASVFAPRLGEFKQINFTYNIILKDVPEPPKVLKNGTLSQAKNQKTTYELYIQAMKDHHKEEYGAYVIDYAEFLDYLKENPKEFFRRVEVHRLQPEIDASIEEFYYTAVDSKYLREQLELGKKEAAYRNITDLCSWDCQYKDICVAGFDGSDVNFLVDALYTREEKENV